MGTNVFKIKNVDEGQDFLVHDVGGVFVEKFCPIRSVKISSQSRTIPNGQSYSFQFFDLDVKDMAEILIIVHSPQDLSYDEDNDTARAEVNVIIDFLTNDNIVLSSLNTLISSEFSWFEPVNPGKSAHSSAYYSGNLPSACDIVDIVAEVQNNSGVDADVTIDIYGSFQNATTSGIVHVVY